MPAFPWVEAIKARLALLEDSEWEPTAAEYDYHQDCNRLLRAVEVLGEAVERESRKPCESESPELVGIAYCSDSKLAIADWCDPCRARRALADVREG